MVIKHIGHPRSLEWIPDLLVDERVANWGIDILDHLLFRRRVDDEDSRVARILSLAENHPNDSVRAKATEIRRSIQRRKLRSGGG